MLLCFPLFYIINISFIYLSPLSTNYLFIHLLMQLSFPFVRIFFLSYVFFFSLSLFRSLSLSFESFYLRILSFLLSITLKFERTWKKEWDLSKRGLGRRGLGRRGVRKLRVIERWMKGSWGEGKQSRESGEGRVRGKAEMMKGNSWWIKRRKERGKGKERELDLENRTKGKPKEYALEIIIISASWLRKERNSMINFW